MRKNILLKKSIRLFFISFMTLVVAALLSFLTSHAVVQAVGTEPTWNLPYGSGQTSVGMGNSGLHGYNVSSFPGGYTLSNPCQSGGTGLGCDASLDAGDYSYTPTNHPLGTDMNYPIKALADGTVLKAWSSCNYLLVDHYNGWWGEYIHLDSATFQVSDGQHVTQGQILGYPTLNYHSGIQSDGTNCGSQSGNFAHVHFALLNSTDPTHATFISMAGHVLCGHSVLTNAQAPNGWDSLQGLTSSFTVPTCPGYAQNSDISLQGSINISPNPVAIGQSYTGTYTVKNNNTSYPYRLTQLWLAIYKSDGTSFAFDAGGDGNSQQIPANSSRTFNVTFQNFGHGCTTCFAGTYNAKAKINTADPNAPWYDLSPEQSFSVVDNSSNITSIADTTHSTIVLFKRGTDGNIWFNYRGYSSSSSWNGWSTFYPNGVEFIGNVGAINQGGTLITVAHDVNNNIWDNYQTTGGWNGWAQLPAIPTSANGISGDVSIATDSNGQTEVFFAGNNGQIWFNYTTGGAWSSWTAIPLSGVQFTGTPSVVLQGASLVVVGRDVNDIVYDTYQTSVPTGWNNWTNIGGYIISDPKIVIDINNAAEVFGIGTDNAMYYQYTVNGAWQGWKNVTSTGQHFVGSPNIMKQCSTCTDVLVVRDSNGTSYDNYETTVPTAWNGFTNLGGVATSDVSELSNPGESNAVYTFVRGTDGDIYWNHTVNGAWQGWQYTPGAPG